MNFKTVLLLSLLNLANPQIGEACTRATYLGPENTVITGRTMDWFEDIRSNLYLFPRGMQRVGWDGPNGLKWESKYGSVVATVYDIGTGDGMNEKGLVANVLYLAESDYGANQGNRKTISIGAWAQYVLDMFATVSEVVTALQENDLQIIAPKLPDGTASLAHLAVSDPSGDSAIFEYIEGKLVIHHGRQYQVMTNSPTYDQQLALDAYWKGIGGFVMLPGTNRASDRFVRASFYISTIPQTSKETESVAGAYSVMCNVSVPLGIVSPTNPNIASTIWRTVADQKNLVYYFSSTQSPNIFWITLSELNLAKGSRVKKLSLTKGEIYSGDAASQFKAAQPFTFIQ